MSNKVAHFDIGCDDVERAKAFYGAVFGWRFKAWGPPDFYLIETGTPDSPGIHGALTKRRTPRTDGAPTSFECTISVPDLATAKTALQNAGGKILMQDFTIEGVGTLVHFEDTEGNHACAMQYLPGQE